MPRPRRPVVGASVSVRARLIELGGTVADDGLPILAPEFAVLSACERASGSTIRRIIREGRFQGVLSIEGLERAASTSLRGVSELRTSLERWRGGDHGHNSGFERLVDRELADDVLEGSVANADIDIDRETFNVDRVWSDLGICAEYDGPPHDDPEQRRLDRLKSTLLVVDGWRLFRIHWRSFERDPAAAVAPLESAVRAARRGRS